MPYMMGNLMSNSHAHVHQPQPRVGVHETLDGGLQIYMCVNSNYQIEDCQSACPSGGCQNTNCASGYYPAN